MQFRIALSSKVNDFNFRRGVTYGGVMVVEFPRSGANWLRDMLSDATGLPCPRFNVWPNGCASILQSHVSYPINSERVVYLYRDPRDVFLSHYHKAWNAVKSSNEEIKRRVLKFHPSLRKNGSDEVRMFDYFDEWMQRPIGSSSNWFEHTSRWLNLESRRFSVITYESLIARPKESLSYLLEQLNFTPTQDSILDYVIKKNSFLSKSGRVPGATNNASNLRRGIAGGWRNEMSESLIKKFNDQIYNYKCEGWIDNVL